MLASRIGVFQIARLMTKIGKSKIVWICLITNNNSQNFHKKISLGYDIISKNEKRFIKINANNDKKTIHNYILNKLGL